jgi:hypothetical protein
VLARSAADGAEVVSPVLEMRRGTRQSARSMSRR